eukprot:4631573-Prymnesium_polylepis.1
MATKLECGVKPCSSSRAVPSRIKPSSGPIVAAPCTLAVMTRVSGMCAPAIGARMLSCAISVLHWLVFTMLSAVALSKPNKWSRPRVGSPTLHIHRT